VTHSLRNRGRGGNPTTPQQTDSSPKRPTDGSLEADTRAHANQSQADERKERGKDADHCEEEQDTVALEAVDTIANPFRRGRTVSRS
jgi:hypothetical protein